MLVFDLVLDLIFPRFCLGCGHWGSLVCSDCYQQLNFLPLTIPLELEPCYLEQLQAVTRYEGLSKIIIHNLKYQSVQSLGQFLGELAVMTTNLPEFKVVTAIPLSQRRKRARGFNQAAVIAQAIAKLTQTPYLPLLKRVRHTAPQASITDRQQRLHHLRNCFAPKNDLITTATPRHQTKLSVLLVDDVTTTGTTLNEAARVLQKMGFKKIYGLAMAHGG